MENQKSVKSHKNNSIWQKMLNWASSEHFIPIVVGPNCCGHHIYHLLENIEEFEIARPEFIMTSADLLIINGRINQQMLPKVKKAYDSLVGKKYVMTVGSCSLLDICTTEEICDENFISEIPVDVHVPGCPPLKDDFIKGLKELKNR